MTEQDKRDRMDMAVVEAYEDSAFIDEYRDTRIDANSFRRELVKRGYMVIPL